VVKNPKADFGPGGQRQYHGVVTEAHRVHEDPDIGAGNDSIQA
jgi:hypothetical protein